MKSCRRGSASRGTTRERPVEILLIEDSPAEARQTIQALRKGCARCHVTVAEDGDEALRLLRSGDCARPDVILLDWFLPKKDGEEVLHEFKNDPAFRQVPIVVLTMSDRQEDIEAAYNGHANSFVTKPTNQEQFARAMRLIEIFWKGRPSGRRQSTTRSPRKRNERRS